MHCTDPKGKYPHSQSNSRGWHFEGGSVKAQSSWLLMSRELWFQEILFTRLRIIVSEVIPALEAALPRPHCKFETSMMSGARNRQGTINHQFAL